VNEVENLREKYQLHEDLPSMRSVGYRQAWDYIEGRISAGELRDRGIFATRQFAKRQLTWFNTLSSVARLDCQAADVQEKVFHATERFTASPAAQS
jgi:tRNA dimethylallyltransferase